MQNFLAKNLKFLRETHRLSKSELAKKIKVSQSTISRWENEEMGCTVDNACEISKVFNISLPDLIGKDLSTGNVYEPTEDDLKQTLKDKGLMDSNGNLDIEKIDMANRVYEAIAKSERELK